MNNAEYWRKRGEILKIASEKQAADYCDFALDEFEKASARIQKEIDAWYMRFAKNNEISFAEAKKWLTSGELKELHWDVQEYIKAGESLDPKWYKALENASSRVHISRLEALKLQIQQQIEALYGGQAKSLDELMSQIYQDSYYRSIFEIQKGFQLGWEIPRLDVEKLSTVLKKPWTTDGRTFSDRIWGNKDQLVNTLHTSLTQGIIRGESPQKIAAQLAKTMNVAKSNASRLIRTETAYFHEQAQKQVYEDLDVEEYEILETLDTRTCAVCGGLDGKVFKKSEHEPGVTAPPFHPNCRGTTVPYFVDDEGERIARDINGKTYYVPSNMTYEEWRKQYIKSNQNIERRVSNASKIVKEKGKVDFNDEHAVLNILEQAEKEFGELNYEMNCTVTADGKVWQVTGQDAVVDPWGIETRGSSLRGSYSYHNHPANVTWYSFSAEDVRFFFASCTRYSQASDDMFKYIMERTQDTIDVDPDIVYTEFSDLWNTKVLELSRKGEIDPDVDGFHEIMSTLSKKYRFIYKREKHNGRK